MKTKVIFLDDEKHILDAYKRNLRDKIDDWDMEFIYDSQQVLERMKKYQYDILVLDLNMPGLSGMDLLEKLNENTGNRIDKIVVTGMDDIELKRKALELGAIDLLTKPVNREDLIARISNTISLRKYKKDLETKNNELMSELIKSQQKEVIGWMASGLSCDLGNLHQIIDGVTELLLIDRTLSSEVQKKINVLNISSKKANNLVNKIMRLGEENFGQSVTDIRLILNEAIQVVNSISGDKDKIKCIESSGPAYTRMDGSHLFQLIVTILRDSLNISSEKEVLISCNNQQGDDYGKLIVQIENLAFNPEKYDINSEVHHQKERKNTVLQNIIEINDCVLDVVNKEEGLYDLKLMINII